MGLEDIYRKKIEGFIRGIKLGTKSIDDNSIHNLLSGLKKINNALSDEYSDEYDMLVKQQRELVS